MKYKGSTIYFFISHGYSDGQNNNVTQIANNMSSNGQGALDLSGNNGQTKKATERYGGGGRGG